MINGMNGMIPEAWAAARAAQRARAIEPDHIHPIHRWFKVLQSLHLADFSSQN
jgi:hypothetical protein